MERPVVLPKCGLSWHPGWRWKEEDKAEQLDLTPAPTLPMS